MVQLEPPFHPLYSKPKWVYCSPLLACPPVLWVFCPGRESLPPPYRRPCAVVSGDVVSSSIPSTICEVAVWPVSAHPPSIRLAFTAQNTPTSQQMRHRVRSWKRHRTRWRITQYFQVRKRASRAFNSCPNPISSTVYSSSSSNSVTLV